MKRSASNAAPRALGLIYHQLITECRSQWPRGLQPLACWDCGFESRRGHGCLSLVRVVCCRVEVSATGRSLYRLRGVVLCDLETSRRSRPWSALGCNAEVGKNNQTHGLNRLRAVRTGVRISGGARYIFIFSKPSRPALRPT